MHSKCVYCLSLAIFVSSQVPQANAGQYGVRLKKSGFGFVDCVPSYFKPTCNVKRIQSSIFVAHRKKIDTVSTRRRLRICLSLQAPEKLYATTDRPSTIKTVDEWVPWTEVALAANIISDFETVSPVWDGASSEDGNLLAKTDDLSDLALQTKRVMTNGQQEVHPGDEPWRSELFYKSTSGLFKLSSYTSALVCDVPVESSLRSAVAQDGYSAADWLVAQRLLAGRDPSKQAVKYTAAAFEWSEYDHKAVAEHYSRRPWAVVLRLAEASVAFATWSVSRVA
jgi:hypothetical protein